MLKRELAAESNGKLPHLSIPSKTAAWVPEFAVEDLPLSRTATLVPEFAVEDLPLGGHADDDDADDDDYKYDWFNVCLVCIQYLNFTLTRFRSHMSSFYAPHVRNFNFTTVGNI